MSGFLNALVAVGNSITVDVTVGNSGSTYGFSSGVIGSISGMTSLKGASILNLDTNTSWDFQLAISGFKSQDFFGSLLVQDTAGNWRLFSSSTAAFAASAPITRWQWGSSTNDVYTATGSSRVIIFY